MDEQAANDRLLSESPCVGVCTLDTGGRCRGCRRSATEIRDWAALSHGERDAINRRNLPHAHPAVSVRLLGHARGRGQRRGGRKNRVG